MRLRYRTFLLFALTLTAVDASETRGQSVQPIISEYSGRADGVFEVTNSGITPEIVLFEPKSFDVLPDGSGVFRTLDSGIHLDLSATSVRLEPQQTARIFYKVRSDRLPAWLCIYAAFTSLKRSEGMNVRIMLPHTVYVYQKDKFPRDALHVSNARFEPAQHRIVCDLENVSDFATRAEQIEVIAAHDSAEQGGFPVLPQHKRTLSIEWKSDHTPEQLLLHFPRFDIKVPIRNDRE